MKTVLRFIFLLVLSIAIPVSGLGALIAPQDKCHVEGDAAASAGTDPLVEAVNGDRSDCCNDRVVFDKDGQDCESTLECPGPHALNAAVVHELVVSAVGRDGLLSFSAVSSGFSFSSIWRPPTAL